MQANINFVSPLTLLTLISYFLIHIYNCSYIMTWCIFLPLAPSKYFSLWSIISLLKVYEHYAKILFSHASKILGAFCKLYCFCYWSSQHNTKMVLYNCYNFGYHPCFLYNRIIVLVLHSSRILILNVTLNNLVNQLNPSSPNIFMFPNVYNLAQLLSLSSFSSKPM